MFFLLKTTVRHYCVTYGNYKRKLSLTCPSADHTVAKLTAECTKLYSDKLSDGVRYIIRYKDDDLDEYLDITDVKTIGNQLMIVAAGEPHICVFSALN